MNTLLEDLQLRALQALSNSYGKELSKEDLAVEITPCTQENLGDYQCNSALKLAKVLKKNPREIAQEMISHFPLEGEKGKKVISHLEVAGPGFINISLSKEHLSEKLQKALTSPSLGIASPVKREKIIVEFSSPNIAKELHVGHLRSTIIGECLARLFTFLGHEVVRLNHIGDWGTQFGMLITYMKREVPKVLSGEEKTDLASLMHWYKESKKYFDSDPQFKKESQLQVVDLQKGEKQALAAWQMICSISRKAFQEIYDLLDVELIERGESFYNPYLPKLIEDLEKKGVIELSNGAKCIFPEGFTNREGDRLPFMVQKSDGGYNYDTTDLAALRHRIEEEKADRIIVVTDAGQSLHFQLLFKAAEKAKIWDPKKVELNHVCFGLVLSPNGKKFKTREGDTEKLIDLLHEAVSHARKILIEKLPVSDSKEIDQLAHVLGIGAIKYADLSSHRMKDYVFSYERMLRFEGNTAVFLLYSYVRIMGIKRKVGVESSQVVEENKIDLQHPSEVALGLHLLRFSEVLQIVARDLLPHRLTDYLYELAEKFNAFFRDCRVEGSKEQNSRLVLCEITAKILQKGLYILGLKTVNYM